jgi:hypothetical protein
MGDAWRPPSQHPRWGADDVIQSRRVQPPGFTRDLRELCLAQRSRAVVRDHLEQRQRHHLIRRGTVAPILRKRRFAPRSLRAVPNSDAAAQRQTAISPCPAGT